MQGHPAAAWGLFPLQEPPKRRALASEDSRSYAPGRLGPMRKTRKQDSKKLKKWPQGLCRHADSASLGAALKLVHRAFSTPKVGSKCRHFYSCICHSLHSHCTCTMPVLHWRMYRARAPLLQHTSWVHVREAPSMHRGRALNCSES